MALPSNPTFTRSSNAYDSNGNLYGVNTPRFQPAKFNQGILVEEGTTNLVQNGDFENSSLSSFGIVNQCSISLDNTIKYQGKFSLKATFTNVTTADSGININYPMSVSTTYTVSGYLYCSTAQTVRIRPLYKNWISLGDTTISLPAGAWTYFGITFTTQADNAQSAVLIMLGSTSNTSAYYLDDVQIEQKPYATSFTNGTRAAESLTIPTAEVLNAQQGTIEVTIIPNWSGTTMTANRVVISSFSGSHSEKYWIGWLADSKMWGIPNAGLLTTVQAFNSGTSISLAVKWDSAYLYLYLNGVFIKKAVIPSDFVLNSLFRLGCFYNTGVELDGVIDDLRISSIARSDSDILTGYNSNQPLPVDQYTTYELSFDNTINQTYVYMPTYNAQSYFNADDFSTAEYNTNSTAQILTNYGYKCTLNNPITNRTNATLDFYDSLNRIESNISALQQSLGYIPTGWITPVTNWGYNMPFDYNTPNRWEQNINLMYTIINDIISELRYCGASNMVCGTDATYL